MNIGQDFFEKNYNNEYISLDNLEEKVVDKLFKSLSIKDYLYNRNHKLKFPYTDFSMEEDKLFIEEDIIIKDSNFKYKLNEHGFRSESFNFFNENNINILFLGCSITHGVGLPEEQTWYKKFVDTIQMKYPNRTIQYYNLSVSGAGFEIMFKNLLTFLDRVGKPNFIIALFPQISRQLKWDGQEYKNAHLKVTKEEFYQAIPNIMDTSLEDLMKDVDVNHAINYSIEDSLMKFCNLMHFTESLCKMSGIKFIWSTWFEKNESIFSNKYLNFKNYFRLRVNIVENHCIPKEIYFIKNGTDGFLTESQKQLLKLMDKKKIKLDKLNINKEPYWTCARDGWHPGSYVHKEISERFFMQFISLFYQEMEALNGIH